MKEKNIGKYVLYELIGTQKQDNFYAYIKTFNSHAEVQSNHHVLCFHLLRFLLFE